MKRFICFSVFLALLSIVLLTPARAQVVDLRSCPAPLFSSKPVTTPVPEYFLDAIDEYQAPFGVPAIARTNLQVGFWYPQPCPDGTWFTKISYDGEFFFYPAPKVDACDALFNLPDGCHSWFFFSGAVPITRQFWFVTHPETAAVESVIAQEEDRFLEVLKKHKAKHDKQKGRKK